MTARIADTLPRRTVLGLAVAGSVLALAVPASGAAATWTTASDVAFPASYRTFLDEHGGASAYIRPSQPAGLLAWETPSKGKANGSSGDTIVRLSSTGALGRQIKVEGELADVGFDASGTATALFVGERAFPGEGLSEAGVSWNRFDRTGRVLSSGSFTQEFLAFDPVVETNPRGDSVVAWLESVGDTVRIRASTHRAGQRGFSAPAELGTDAQLYGSIAAAISNDGRALIAYTGPLQTAVAKAAKPTKVATAAAAQVVTWTGQIGSKLRGPTAIGHRGDTNPAAGFDGLGRGYVMWQGDGRHTAPQIASIGPRAKAFSPAIDLDPGQTEYAEPFLAVDPAAGGAVVAWCRNKPYPLLVATIAGNGRMTSRQAVSHGLPSDLAIRNGVAAVATDDGLGFGHLKVAVRDRGAARFGALERVTRRTVYGSNHMLSVDGDGRVRVTVDIDESARRAPRLVSFLRSPR